MTLYLIGSLRNPRIVELGNVLREAGYDTFEDWHAGGPQADDEWMRYEKQRGRTYKQALAGYHAAHVFEFDLHHLNRADAAVLVTPAGKSAHLELGYVIGRGKPGYILIDEEEKSLPSQWHWLTALYEGEGTLTRNSNAKRNAHAMCLSITMKDQDVLERAYLAAKVGTLNGPYIRREPKWSPMFRWAVNCKEDILYVLNGMWGGLGQRRKEQAINVLRAVGLTEADILASPGPYETRWDVMTLFATKVCFNLQELIDALNVDGPSRRTVDHAPWNA